MSSTPEQNRERRKKLREEKKIAVEDGKKIMKVRLMKVKLDSRGYDWRGSYYGVTDIPLWEASWEVEGKINDLVFRARNRALAKETISIQFKTHNYYPVFYS